MATIEIPSPLRKYAKNQEVLKVPGGVLLKILIALNAEYPQLKTSLLSDNEKPHAFVNFYINGQDIRLLDNLYTVIQEADVVTIIPALAGG